MANGIFVIVAAWEVGVHGALRHWIQKARVSLVRVAPKVVRDVALGKDYDLRLHEEQLLTLVSRSALLVEVIVRGHNIDLDLFGGAERALSLSVGPIKVDLGLK